MSNHHDRAPTPAAALELSFPMSSADRARFWAGINRFVVSDASTADTRTPEPAPVLRRNAESQ